MRKNKHQIAELHYDAWDLRLKGYSYRAIGKQMGIGHETARRWVEEVWATKSIPMAEQVRSQEFERLMRYLEKLDSYIDMGSEKHISIAIKISERLCRMTGADIPVTQHVAITETTQTDLEVMDLINSVRAQAALERDRITGLTSTSPEKAPEGP